MYLIHVQYLIISYFVLILIIQSIKCNQTTIFSNTTTNLIFGVYRIDAVNKIALSLSFLENKLEFSIFKNLNNLFRIYPSEIKSFYYIELRSNKFRIGVKENNDINLYKKKNKQININQIIWEIIQVSPNKYLIKNKYNKKYLQKINNSIKCIEDYDLISSNLEKESFKFSLIKLYEEPKKKKEYKKLIEEEPIDVVYKYIEPSNKASNKKEIKEVKKDEDNEELRYSIRSILSNIPWIRKIFIISSKEKLEFLKPIEEIKNKIIYIKDKDLLGYDSDNNQAVIYNFFKLDKFGVSENFIYMENDYFIGKPLNKSHFFYYEENEKKVKPCIINNFIREMNRNEIKKNFNKYFENKENISPNSLLRMKMALATTDNFFVDNYNSTKLIYTYFTKNAIPLNILDFKEISQELEKYKYLNQSLYSTEKNSLRIIVPHFYSLYYLNIKNRKVRSIPYLNIKFEKAQMYKLFIPLFSISIEGEELRTQNENNVIDIIKKKFPYPTDYEFENLNHEKIKNKNFDKDKFHLKTKNLRGYEGQKNIKITIILYFLLFSIIAFILFTLYRRNKGKNIIKYTRIKNFEE